LLNPWSVCNKPDVINEFIVDNNIDILALTETWLTGTGTDSPIIAAMLPPGYGIIHVPRASRGGGTAVVFRLSISISRVSIDGQVPSTFEVIECLVKLPIMLRLCIVYRPPGTAFLDDFSEYLSNVISKPGHLIIAGDFNEHVENPADRRALEFLNTLSSFGLSQHVTKPTHKSNHILDLFITSTTDNIIKQCTPLDYDFPDHFPVFAEINVKKPLLPQKHIQYRKTRQVTKEALCDALATTPLMDASLEQASLDELILLYDQSMRNVLDRVAPLKSRTITLRPEALWYTDDIRAAKQSRRQFERLWRSSGLAVHREMFVAAKNQVKALIQQAKKNYYRNRVAECNGNNGQLFRVVTCIAGFDTSSPLPSSDDVVTLANDFSNFFIDKVSRIQSSIPSNNMHSAFLTTPYQISTPMTHFIPVTQEAIMKIIASSPNKQCDLDPMPTHLLKLVASELCSAISQIINCSLETGTFPSAFKTALVSPLLKKSSLDPECYNNYRPVSNLSFISKTLERVVKDQLMSHLEQNNLLECYQSAYRANHSTETALLRVHTDIRCALGDQKVVLMAMLDLSAAFDTVDHSIAINSLSSLGVSGVALKWFASYLQDHSQVVQIKRQRSANQPLNTGVPQGSVLGPVLFSLYTKSITDLLRRHDVQYHLYADDSQIYVTTTIDELDNAQRKLEECLAAVQQWMVDHSLKLNPDKTEFIVFASREVSKRLPPRLLHVGSAEVEQSQCVKNLGFYMNTNLTYEQHVNNVCRVGYLQLKLLSKLKRFLDKKSLEIVIHAFISTRIDYCNSLLSGINDSCLRKLQLLQNACARLLTGSSRFDHITPVLCDLHWLPVKQRIVFKILVLTYKCFHSSAPDYLKNLLTFYQPVRNFRRDHLLLCQPFTRSSHVQMSAFNHIAPFYWNKLPFTIRSSPSIDIFKSRVKTHLFTEYYF